MAIDPKLRETVLSNLRSVTQSCKGGVPFDRLQRDYRDLLGTPIPFRDLGHNTLEAFIYSIPDVITVRRNNEGQLVAFGVADQSTAHIVSLVSRQKTENKKPQKTKPRYRSGFASYRTPALRSRENVRPAYNRYQNSSGPYRNSSSSWSHPDSSPSPPQQMVQPTRQSNIQNSRPHLPNRSLYEKPPRFLNRPKEVVQNLKPPLLPSPKLCHSFEDPFIETPIPHYQPRIPSPAKNLPKKPAPVEAVHEPQPDPDANPQQYVKNYAETHGLSLEYKTVKCGQKKKYFISSLHLGDNSYSTYDINEELQSKDEAELAAAKMAVADIIKNKETKDMFPVTLTDNTESQQALVDRILEIVWEKPTGIFSNGVLREYEIRFNETLPGNWLDIIKNITDLDVEVPRGTQLPKGICILRRARDSSSGYTTPSSTSSKTEKLSHELDATTLSNSIANMKVSKIPPLELPMGNQWDVFITNVESTTSIACRLIEYADDFADMSEKMKSFYSLRSYPARDVSKNYLYAASFDNDDDQLWHRVRVDSVGQDGQVSCFFIDDGDVQDVNISNLQELDRQFCTLPCQALNLKLADLEEYENVVKVELLKEHLIGRSLVAEVLARNGDGFTVILYNTAGENDVNLNEVLREITISSSLKWELPMFGESSIAYLTHVTETGELYLRFNCPHLSILEAEMEKMCPKFEEIVEGDNNVAPSFNTICAAKYVDDTWYRAVCLGYSDSSNSAVNVLFIDYGNTESVSLNRICNLEQINKFLACSIPSQAVKCGLHKVPPLNFEWTNEAVEKLIDLCPVEQELIVRVESTGEGTKLPMVNIFKRNQDSCIISINETLAIQSELFRKSSATPKAADATGMKLPLKSPENPSAYSQIGSPIEARALFKSIPDVAQSADEQIARRRNEFGPSGDNGLIWVDTPDISSPLDVNEQSPKALSYPEIPDIGNEFDVFVTVAASPSNFVVQPFKSGENQLEKLMKDMNNFYSDEDNHCPMIHIMLKENHFYAALHEDNYWYRVRICKVMQSETVMVHFVDYGDFSTVNMSNLQRLYQQFTVLPCQAIRASLSGVRPNGTDWDPMQCVKFQELVKQKAFVSIVKDKQPSNDLNFPIVMHLLLIDTSSESDVCVNNLLVDMKIARAS